MDFEVGDRVVRKINSHQGFVVAVRKNRATMVEVRWDNGAQQWLPQDELRPSDIASTPPVRPSLSTWGRSTPQYLIELRTKIRRERPAERRKAKVLRLLEEEELANKLVSLSETRKNRSRMAAQKMIQEYKDAIDRDRN